MIFVDTNVFMYAVGRPHPLQDQPGTECVTRTDKVS
jgi:predicted nucleic acid-binding protein